MADQNSHLSNLMILQKRWGFTHIISSPHNPQSNGKAEAAVKSMENPAGQEDH